MHKMWNDYELSKMVEGGVPFHMASDQAGNVGRAYGVWDENQGIELRGRFIIDPDGVIQAMEVLTPRSVGAFAESVRQIQAFQLVRASGGKEATPAGGNLENLPLTWSRLGGQGLGSVEARDGIETDCSREGSNSPSLFSRRQDD